MSRRVRRKFTATFKTEVVLEALKERKTMSELAQQFDLHPNRIATWKKEFLSGAAAVFETRAEAAQQELEAERDQLYRQIGKLQVENDFQKKGAAMSRSEQRPQIDRSHSLHALPSPHGKEVHPRLATRPRPRVHGPCPHQRGMGALNRPLAEVRVAIFTPMEHTPPLSRGAMLVLSGLSIAGVLAQTPEGGCSITLVSAESTIQQGYCVSPVNVTIEPVVYAIQGTGFQIDPLPPGVTATLVDDTLTIAGTITTTGYWTPGFSLNEGCSDFGPFISVSQIVDPGLTCAVVGDSITVSWPGLDAPAQYEGIMSLLWTDGVDLLGNAAFFMPSPGSFNVGGLPTNTPITFYLSMSSGIPNCFNGDVETTCTIISEGIGDAEADEIPVRAIPRGDVLELSAPFELNDVRIYDMLGGLVSSQSMNARAASIPIAALAPGAFILRVTDANGRVSTQRFVKE